MTKGSESYCPQLYSVQAKKATIVDTHITNKFKIRLSFYKPVKTGVTKTKKRVIKILNVTFTSKIKLQLHKNRKQRYHK